MTDECVVCGEAVEGKPLYKKLGSGEFNVEVITALRALQLTLLPETAKNDSYICWDCDEVIVGEYGRYLENEKKQQVEVTKQKPVKKQHRAQQKKKQHIQSRKKQKATEAVQKKSTWTVHQPETKPKPVKSTRLKLSKTKQLELKRANNAHHSTHCVMCDKNFESGDRGCQRFPLKKRVNDELDIAQVMEQLGLARHIEPKMKGRRFVCNPCFFIIRRTYKNKVMKGTSTGGSSTTQGDTTPAATQNPIHRATTEEHAAEIAKLLPPALAECYKILTSDCMTKRMTDDAKNVDPVHQEKKEDTAVISKKAPENDSDKDHQVSCESRQDGEQDDDQGFETEAEEDDTGLNVSQDEHGNYFIDMDVMSSSGSELDDDQVAEVNEDNESGEENLNGSSPTPRKKKNVLLPRRSHHHLSVNHSDEERQPDTQSLTQETKTPVAGKGSKKEVPTRKQAEGHTGICNICGISFTGKPQDWWHTLTSPLSGFESITVTMALKLLETSLAHTSKEARDARQVCLPCYGMVSTGFRSQVVQKIARQNNISASQVNFSKVKVRMIPKEDLKPVLKNRSEDGREPVIENRETHCKETGEHEKENLVDSDKRGRKRKFSYGVEGKRKKKKIKGVQPKIRKTSIIKYGDKDENKEETTEIQTEISPNMTPRENCLNNGYSTKSGRKIRLSQKYVETEEEHIYSDEDFIDTKEDNNNKKMLKTKKETTPIMTERKSCQNKVYSTKSGRKIRLTQKCIETEGDYDGSDQDFIDSEDEHSVNTNSEQKLSQITSQNYISTLDNGQDYLRGDTDVWSDSGGESSVMDYFNKPSLSAQMAKSSPRREDDSETKKPKAVVVLKDLKCILPQEAFGGKAVSAVKIEGNIGQQSPTSDYKELVTSEWTTQSCHSSPDQGAYSSPLQFIFNSMSASLQTQGTCYSKPIQASVPEAKFAGTCSVNKDAESSQDIIQGCCVVCGRSYMVPKNFWHSIEENIKPPLLMVPVRWVCLSLSVAALPLSQQDQDEGKVCKHCYARLAKQFEIFVKMKVGESCGLSPKAVDLSEYLITFNQATMNIEADPNQSPSAQEFEDVGQLLQKILPVIQSFSIDDVVARSHRQPLSMQDYTVWLLLVLNDLRIQTGASIGDLASWLIRLMPTEMYDKGLRPCLSNLATFLLSITKSSSIFTEDRLSAAIPPEVFILDIQSQDTLLSTSNVPAATLTHNIRTVRHEQSSRGDKLNYAENEWDDGDILNWEEFLTDINLDDLMKGTAKPLSVKQFSNGVLYALWRLSQMLGESVEVIVNRLRQLSPVPLQKEQLENLVISCAGPLHSHLEKYPHDIHKLKCELISQLKSRDSLQTPEQQNHGNNSLCKMRQSTGRKKYKTSRSPRVYKRKVEKFNNLTVQENKIDRLGKLEPNSSGIIKKKRGRPRKHPLPSPENVSNNSSLQENGIDRLGKCLSEVSGIKRKRGRPRKNPLPISGNGMTAQGRSNNNTHHEQTVTSAGVSSTHSYKEEIGFCKTTRKSTECFMTQLDNTEENNLCKSTTAVSSPPRLLQKKNSVPVEQVSQKVNLENVEMPDSIRKKDKPSQIEHTEAAISHIHNFEDKVHNGVRQVSRSRRNARSVTSVELESAQATTEKDEGREKLPTPEKQQVKPDHPNICDAKENESLQISSMLVNKMKELERQLEEMKKRNNELMEDNRKLVRVCFDSRNDEVLDDQQQQPTGNDSKNVESPFKQTSYETETGCHPHKSPAEESYTTTSSLNNLPDPKIGDKKGKRAKKHPKIKKDENLSEKHPSTRRQQGRLHESLEGTKSPQLDGEKIPLKMETTQVGIDKSKSNENDAKASHKMLTDVLPQPSLKRKSTSRDTESLHLDSERKGRTLKNTIIKKDKKEQKTKVTQEGCLHISGTSDRDITQAQAKEVKHSHTVTQTLGKSPTDLKKESGDGTSSQNNSDKSRLSRKWQGSSKKKAKPRFEDLMNYDAGVPP